MARPVEFSAQHILSGAARAFRERGYGNTSLRQLMAAAGVSTTAFYARFDSKQAVLIALVENMMGEIAGRGAVALASVGSLDEGIERGIEVLVTALHRHRAVAALALTEGAAIPEVRTALGRAYERLAALLAGHIAATLDLTRDDAEARAWALIGALQLQVARWAVFRQLGERDLAPALAGVARSLLAGGPRARRPR